MPVDRLDIADTSGAEAQVQNQLNQGGTVAQQTFNEGYERIQEDFDARIAQIETDKEVSTQAFNDQITDIRTQYETEKLDPNELLGGLRETYQQQIGNISNVYNAQIAREAERVDALVAGGSLGGNSYRAFQAQSESSRNLMGQAMGQIAELTVNAETKLSEMGVSVAQTNAQLFGAVNQTISSLVASQAESMLSYSQLLTQTEVSAESAIQNLYGLSLQERQLEQQLLLESRAQDIQIELGYLQAQTQLEVAMMNRKPTMMAGRTILTTGGKIANSYERNEILSIR